MQQTINIQNKKHLKQMQLCMNNMLITEVHT